MVFENGTDLVMAEQTDVVNDSSGNIIRVDTGSGKQSVAQQVEEDGAFDIAVAGVDQVPPMLRPRANTDLFDSRADLSTLDRSAPGVLANDSDPLKQKLSAVLAGPTTTEAGTINLRPDGSFTYSHAKGFVGTARYFYKAVAGARESAVGTILIDVKPTPLPQANPDKFSMIAEAGQMTGNVKANDTDPMSQPTTAVLAGPGRLEHGFVSFFKDGFFFYFPDKGFTGTDTFDYRLVADDGRTSERGHVSIQVLANTAPSATVVASASSVPAAANTGTFVVRVSDALTAPRDLKVTAATSNTALVPAANIKVGPLSGAGGIDRALTITPVAGKTGTAVVTLKVTDTFAATRTLPLVVNVGGTGNDTLIGSSGADLLLGGGGNDKLSGLAGVDLLGGGAGDDSLTGGTNADVFRGGSGINSATDFHASEGDRTFEVK